MRFLLVDEIVEMQPGHRIHATKFIAPEEDYFRDHFPGFPVVPGVLLTEMMAQAVGKCLDAENPQRGKSMLARIATANFRDWVRPGQTAHIYGEVSKSRPQFGLAKCRIEVENRIVCSAELLFSFVLMEKISPGYRDEVLDRFMARQKTGPDISGVRP